MIGQATVDAYGNSEQITSWFTSSPMATLLCDSQSKLLARVCICGLPDSDTSKYPTAT